MANQSARVTVGTTATRLDAIGGDNRDGTTVLVRCPTADIYLGGSDVTTANGYLLPAGEAFAQDVSGTDALYGRVPTTPVVVHVLRSGV